MAKTKHIPDEQIISALMHTGKVTAAAAEIGCNPCTIYERQKDPAFMKLYNSAKTDSVRYAVKLTSSALDTAYETLKEIMQDRKAPPKDRINAADKIIQSYGKFIEALNDIDRNTAAEEEKRAEAAQNPFSIFG